MQNSNEVSTISASGKGQIIKESHVQPVWHVIVLNLLTVGFYAPFWFLKNARQLAKRLQRGSNEMPEAKAQEIELALLSSREKNVLALVKRVPPLFIMLGIALPIINLILGSYFFKMTVELYPHSNSWLRRHSTMVGIGLAVLMVGALCLSKLANLYFLFYCLAISIPLSISQFCLNNYWRSVENDPNLLVRHSFSTIELVALILGSLLLALIIAGFVLLPSNS